jgi:tetratricopeptide (TPR) repeat protein
VTRARSAVAALLVAVAAAAAAAEDAPAPGELRREVESALRSGGPGAAAAVVDRVLEAPRVRARNVEAARAAMELLPHDVAAPRAAQLLAEALKMERGDREAWNLAMTLRKDLLRRVDVETGTRFLEKLDEVYPGTPAYRYDLAGLLLDGGRREEARALLRSLFETDPAGVTEQGRRWAVYELARLSEEADDVAGARAAWDRILEVLPLDPAANVARVRVLARTDQDAAQRALDDATRAAAAAPSEAARQALLDALDRERRRLARIDARRAEIRGILERIDAALALALGGWTLAVAGLLWGTRARAVPPDDVPGSAPEAAGGSRPAGT